MMGLILLSGTQGVCKPVVVELFQQRAGFVSPEPVEMSGLKMEMWGQWAVGDISLRRAESKEPRGKSVRRWAGRGGESRWDGPHEQPKQGSSEPYLQRAQSLLVGK